jgi:hypothetical protein
MHWIGRSSGPLLLAFAATFLIAQVLVRPAVGIANNGDFPKMAGPFGLGPEDRDWNSHKQYGEFVYRYVRADRYIYNRGFKTAEFWSSEFFFVKLARGLQRIFQPGPRFDIRWLGGVYSAFLLMALGVWFFAFAPRFRLLPGLLAVLICTDVAYVQYLNSFYMDTPAIVFLILATAAGLHVAYRPDDWVFPPVMVLATLLFATSKSQHAVSALVLGLLFIGFACLSRNRTLRRAWIASSVVVVVMAVGMVRHDSPDYQSTGVFNIVFLRIAPEAPDPLQALRELGLGKNEMRYLRTHAYFPDSPMADPAWARAFALRCNHITLIRYYLHHPSVPIRLLYEGLSTHAADMRPWGNLSLDDGFKPDAQSTAFSYWSDFRGFLLRRAPWHMILLVLTVLGTAIWLLVRSPRDRACAGLTLAILVIAVLEYGVAELVDAAETQRHVMISNLAMDLSILLLLVLVWRVWIWRRNRRLAGNGPAVSVTSDAACV